MKKVFSVVLVLCLVLTLVVSAMPSNQSSSVEMNGTQMAVSVGGDCNYVAAAGWGLGAILASATPFGWFCAGVGASLLLQCY
jgi:hypothetical protein